MQVVYRGRHHARFGLTLLCALAGGCGRQVVAAGRCPDEGRAWTTPQNAFEDRIYDVVAGSPTSAYAVGYGTVLRWDGCRWSRAPAPPLPPDKRWQRVHAWASSSGELWLVASPSEGLRADIPPEQRARVLRFTGTSWRTVSLPPAIAPERFAGITGSGRNDIWILGDGASPWLIHGDGDHFAGRHIEKHGIPSAIGLSPTGDVWIGFRGLLSRLRSFNGVVEDFPAPQQIGYASIKNIVGLGPDDIWARFEGPVWRLKAGRWINGAPYSSSPVDALRVAFLWGNGSTLFAGKDGTILSWNGSHFETVFTFLRPRRELGYYHWAPGGPALAAGAMAAPQSGWALGQFYDQTYLYRWDGRRWGGPAGQEPELVALLPRANAEPLAVKASLGLAAGDQAGAIDEPGPGGTVRSWPLAHRPLGVWSDGRDAWVVGEHGSALFSEGGGPWREVGPGTDTFMLGVWQAPTGDVWASGMRRARRVADGPTPEWRACGPRTVHAYWGSAADDVWAAGEDGLAHFDGEQWITLQREFLLERRHYGTLSIAIEGRHARIYALWGSGARDVWAVGRTLTPAPQKGVVFHFDGDVWTEVPTCHLAPETRGPLYAVWGRGPDDVWAAGQAGTLLHWDGRAFRAVSSGSSTDLVTIAGAGGHDVWAGAANGEVTLVRAPPGDPTPAPAADSCDLPKPWERQPPPGAVEMIVAAHKQDWRRCFEGGRGKDQTLAVDVDVERDGRIFVTPSGRRAATPVDRCIANVMRRVRLPATAFERPALIGYKLSAAPASPCPVQVAR